MRKIQQKQILDVLKTIDEAQVNGFYADCQDGAIAIGEYIEGIAGEGTQTVTLLEEYLDLLVLACNGKTSVKTLRRHIIKVENSVKSELTPTKIEALFLPYKVSMWDSLESIYLAAKADPACDAYVVPIPSYELNPDGTLGQMHYDGEQYPNSIPVINWQDYDIEARQPDVIFIHYAYDDYVSNATVHPIFYSERLRQNCEQLIYVPYYALGGETIDDYNALLPGVRNAHHVIVESEAIRESYIEFYEKYDKEYGWKGIYGKAEDKFIALGSPKLDKVINSKPEDFTLPEKWAKLINNPDGTKKKAILFNTHMFKWIDGGEQYFKKLRFIFETFKNRDDVVLWWRPHPNTELNFRTKNPIMLDEYLDTINTYQSEGWGIYDDTPDLHRAIACTDAYFGDGSSIVSMYKATGKPAMLSENSITSDEFNIPVTSIYFTDEHIWFTARYINAFFKLNRSDNKLQLIGSFPSENASFRFWHSLYGRTVAENDNSLYFAPLCAKEIAVYSISNNTFNKIPFESSDIYDDSGAFHAATSHGKYVFFTPAFYPAILRLNTETNEISYISDWITPLEKLTKGNSESFFNALSLAVGHIVWLIIPNCNAVMAFDMEYCTHEIFEIGSKDYRFINMAFDGQNFWLSPHMSTKTPVIKWHPQNGIIKEFSEVFEHSDNERDAFTLACCDDCVLLIPFCGKHFIKINISTDEMQIVDEFGEHPGDGQKFSLENAFGDRLLTYDNKKNSFALFNCKTKEISEEPIQFTPDIIEELSPQLELMLNNYCYASSKLYSEMLVESKTVRLSDYIHYVAKNTASDAAHFRDMPLADGEVGTRIYNFLKG